MPAPSARPELLRQFDDVGFTLSCAGHTRRVVENTFKEKGMAAEDFLTVWLQASNRWVVAAVDAGARREDLTKWVGIVKVSPTNRGVEDFCFEQGIRLLEQTPSEDREMIEKRVRSQLSIWKGAR